MEKMVERIPILILGLQGLVACMCKVKHLFDRSHVRTPFIKWINVTNLSFHTAILSSKGAVGVHIIQVSAYVLKPVNKFLLQ